MPYYPEKVPEPSGEEQKQKKMTEKRKRLLRLSAVAVSCALILYGSVRLIQYYADLNASRNTSRELKQIYMQEEAIRKLESRSAISSVLDVRADDQILLLVTCLDGDTERLVVAARRLRDGETEESLVVRQNQ